MTVLIDTGVLYAFLNKDDENHDVGLDLVTRVARGEWGAPFVSDYVADELFTLIRVRGGGPRVETAARRLLPFPEPALPGLSMVPVAPDHIEATLAAFERHRARRISFTDASHLAIMKALDVDALATLDQGFDGLAPLAE
ncbi:MAG: type II toxin-antitoxin system VapC family toxin [Methanobacteriota archaeon]